MFAGVSQCGCVISLVLNFEQTMNLSRWTALLVDISLFFCLFVNRFLSFVSCTPFFICDFYMVFSAFSVMNCD